MHAHAAVLPPPCTMAWTYAPSMTDRPRSWTFVTDEVIPRLGMWTGRPTYERAVNLIVGFDLAQTESIQDRMQQRLTDRHGPSAIAWPWLILAEAIGADIHNPPDLGPITPEQDAAAIDHLRRELIEVTKHPG